jgi:hypothetical protein
MVDGEENSKAYPATTEATTSAPHAPIAIPAAAATTASDHLPGVRRSSRQRSKTAKTSTKTTIVPPAVVVSSQRTSPRSGLASASYSPRSRGASPSITKCVSFPSVWVCPDTRDKTAVLTEYLIERHLKTLNDNFHTQKFRWLPREWVRPCERL